MDGVSDTVCKYHSEYFMTIFHVKIIGDNDVKKVSVLTIFCGEIYMFFGQIFAKNAYNDPKTLFETSKSVKK